MSDDATVAYSGARRLFAPKVRAALLVLLFAAALGIRLVHLGNPPMEVAAMRQYYMANVARHFYFESAAGVPQWRRDVSAALYTTREFNEPPILERLAAWGYRLLGGERLWVPRVLSIIFYLVGAAALYPLARSVASPDAALLAVGFFLFTPFGVVASRSFQPDPMMLMFFILALLVLWKHHAASSRAGWWLAALFGALSILIKPQSVFMLLTVVATLSVVRRRSWKGLVSPSTLLLGGLMVLPGLVYYGYHVLPGGGLAGAPQHFMVPSLLLKSFFWGRWLYNLDTVVGAAAVVATLVALPLMSPGLARGLMAGGLIGYVLFGLIFSHGLHVHNYYTLPLLPFAAVGVGFVGDRLLRMALGAPSTRVRRGVVALALALAVALCMPTIYRDLVHRAGEYDRVVDNAKRIGDAVGHSTRCIILDREYGEPLRYHGEIDGVEWPDPLDYVYWPIHGATPMTTAERLDDLMKRGNPEYFVVGDKECLRSEGELLKLLRDRYPVVVETIDYVVFDPRARAK